MPKTRGHMDIRDTFVYGVSSKSQWHWAGERICTANNAGESESKDRDHRTAACSWKNWVPVGNSRKSPYLWGPWLVITGFYFESQESRQLFRKATWLLRSSLGETTVTAHGCFGVLRDMEIAFHAGIRGDNTFMGGRQFLASSQLFCPTCFRSITTLLYAAACSGLVHCWR